MKKIKLLLIVFVVVGCKVSQIESGSRMSHLLYKRQSRLSKAIADGAYFGRNNAIEKGLFKSTDKFDTLWVIERVDEIDKRVETSFWDNERKVVIKYSVGVNFESSEISYNFFDDPLKEITERFDTSMIGKGKSYLGASHVFISRVTKNGEVLTYYFIDITPINYFNNN